MVWRVGIVCGACRSCVLSRGMRIVLAVVALSASKMPRFVFVVWGLKYRDGFWERVLRHYGTEREAHEDAKQKLKDMPDEEPNEHERRYERYLVVKTISLVKKNMPPPYWGFGNHSRTGSSVRGTHHTEGNLVPLCNAEEEEEVGRSF